MTDLAKIRDWLSASAAFVNYHTPFPPGIDGSDYEWVRRGLKDRAATFAGLGIKLPDFELWRIDPVRAILDAHQAVEGIFGRTSK